LKNFGNLFISDNSNEQEKVVETQILYAQIGQLKVENDFLKKKLQ